jgi:hypothetical protein
MSMSVPVPVPVLVRASRGLGALGVLGSGVRQTTLPV